MPTTSKPTTVKKTTIWPTKMWAEIEAAARHLSQTMGSDTTVPAFIRGAVQRRLDEVRRKPGAKVTT